MAVSCWTVACNIPAPQPDVLHTVQVPQVRPAQCLMDSPSPWIRSAGEAAACPVLSGHTEVQGHGTPSPEPGGSHRRAQGINMHHWPRTESPHSPPSSVMLRKGLFFTSGPRRLSG